MIAFAPFPKMARLSRECVITEKIDGTNAQIFIAPANCITSDDDKLAIVCGDRSVEGSLTIFAGSRNRWITPASDNYGFAKWVLENATELAKLGVGQHFGEWWGKGIQRGYGLSERRFSLFNTARWAPVAGDIRSPGVYEVMQSTTRPGPACCHVVPVLYRGPFHTDTIGEALDDLETNGSAASPGFDRPEGVVIYHEAAKTYFKKTLKDDEKPKSIA
jgi:hypothetical protein